MQIEGCQQTIATRIAGWRHWLSPAVLPVIVWSLVWGGNATAANPLQDLPLELRPYRVHLAVGLDKRHVSKQAASELLEATRQASRRCLGTCWQLTIVDADWLQPVSEDGISRLKIADIAGHSTGDPEDFDLWAAAAITSSGSGFRIDVRSWQPAVAAQSEHVSDAVQDRRDIPPVLLQLCHAAFRPVGIVDAVDGKRVRVLLQAGALSVPDEGFALMRTVTLFSVVMASRDRHKKIARLFPIPWTYLSVEETQAAGVTCELHSGLRSPIGGKQRGRVETLAVAVKAISRPTLLELATQSKPSLPLVAHRIELRDSPEIPAADTAQNDAHLLKVLLTDRRGHVIVQTETSSLVWVFAYSGRQLLARVPIVPGLSDRVRLEVSDDSARLLAEADLYTLQGQLIEAVAARTTATARARAAIKKNDIKQAKSAEADLRRLPSSQVYLDRVTAIRVPALKAAQARKDRAGESRIKRMCDDMAEIINQHLSEDKRLVVLEELRELYSHVDVIEKTPEARPQ